MEMAFTMLKDHPRLLLEASLRPVQGDRFQPTGFPDLGAASYVLPDGTEMLLVESAQSMANRMEDVMWDRTADDLVSPLRGLPYVRVRYKNPDGKILTNSILEAHRLNSSYILGGNDDFLAELAKQLGPDQTGDEAALGASDVRRLASVVFRYDPNAVLHGVFLARKELAGGRLRLPRLLSAFIEARDARPAESGGVKVDRLRPSTPEKLGYGTKSGYGNVPFHRTEYVAARITAYFSLDVAQLRAYTLGEPAEDLLVGMALWKIRSLLSGTLRLRTACDFDCVGIQVTRPKGYVLPALGDLSDYLPRAIAACPHLKRPPITDVVWDPKVAKARAQKEDREHAEEAEARAEEEGETG